MRVRKKNLIIVVISLIVIGINHIGFSKYDENAELTVRSEIAKAIINLEKDEVIISQIDERSFPIEYNFSIHNYKEEDINQIDFDYIIEIETSVDNFPVSYMLFDCDNNTEIKLIDGKTEPMKISKNIKQCRNFKLYLQWRELDAELAEEVQINLKVSAVQSKEEKVNEI